MRRDRRFRYDWNDRDKDDEQGRPDRERLDVNQMIGKMLPWALVLGVAAFFLERWLAG